MYRALSEDRIHCFVVNETGSLNIIPRRGDKLVKKLEFQMIFSVGWSSPHEILLLHNLPMSILTCNKISLVNMKKSLSWGWNNFVFTPWFRLLIFESKWIQGWSLMCSKPRHFENLYNTVSLHHFLSRWLCDLF